MSDARPVLDPAAEQRTEQLIDGYELGQSFDLAAVVGPSTAARAEVAARLSALGPMLRLAPSGRILADLEARLGELGAGRPILWVEADPWDRDAWSGALAAMNSHREWLRDQLPGLLVLAGPAELFPLALERPDLGTLMGTVVHVERDPTPPGAAGVVRWLHLSDLHFTDSVQWDRRAVSQSLLTFLKDDVLGQGLAPDLVFVTGDVANSGKPIEYDQAEQFFRALMGTLALDPRKHLFIVPGNHDVDRSRVASKRMAGLLVKALLAEATQDALTRSFNDADELNAMGDRLEAFYAFTQRLLGDARGWSATRPWRADVAEVRGVPIGIAQLNTAWASGANDDKGKLLIGEAQVEGALAELADARVKVALMHHPTGYLADFDETRVDALLTSPRGVDFVLRGHLHEQRLALEVGPGVRTAKLAAGATYQAKPWPIGCQLVELDLDQGEARVHLFGYADRDGGFWHRDSGVYQAAKDGLWRFELPPHLRPMPGAPASGAAPKLAAPPSPSVTKARVDRYRAACIAVNGAVSFLGLPNRSTRAPRTTLDKLFAPLTVSTVGDEALPLTTLTRHLISGRNLTVTGETAVRAVLLGDPGSGKTTLTRFLAVWAAGGVDLDGVDRPTDLVPLRISFREMNRTTRTDFLAFLEDQSKEALSAPCDRAFFEHLLDEGQALVLLDGLDEVASTDRDAANGALRAFAQRFPRAPILVTSRVVGYDEAPLPGHGLPRGVTSGLSFAHFTLLPLSDDGLETLVRRWYDAREADLRERQRLVADLLARLADSPSARHLARTPLLATLICMVHGQRATIPGRRAKLYELVVDTLLETWEEARGGRFGDIDLGRQRRYLEDLALAMQRRRVADAKTRRRGPYSGDITLEHDALVQELTRIAIEGRGTDDEPETRHRLRRWVDWLTARTGLLVEQRPGAYGFLHLTLMEFLAACALEREGGDALANELRTLAEEPGWHETILLAIGRRADDTKFAASAFEALHGASPACDALLVLALREELDMAEGPRRQVVAAAMTSAAHLWLDDDLSGVGAALLSLVRYSERHGERVRHAILDHLRTSPTLNGAPFALLEALTELVGEPNEALALSADLAKKTSDGDALYGLWAATEAVAQRWPEATAAAATVRASLFDHLAAPPRAMFETLTTVHDGPKPYWCEVPAGTFWMGSSDDDEDAAPDERPRHAVTLTRGFALGAAPITNGQYQAFDPTFVPVGWPGVASEELLDHPAVRVSWYAATSFCRWLSARAPWAAGARLPTEAEWERACRAGTDTRYGAGDSEADLARVAWYLWNAESRTHRVAEKSAAANAYGLYDMLGNVYEWTADAGLRRYTAGDVADPLGPPVGGGRVVRGGYFWHMAQWCRSARREIRPPGLRVDNVGFRVLLPR